MTKTELVKALAEDLELPRRQVVELVDAMLAKITSALRSGDKVLLAPFGQLKVRDRAARMGRNPQTGEPVPIPAKRVLRFTPSRILKELLGSHASPLSVLPREVSRATRSKISRRSKEVAPVRKTAKAGQKKAGRKSSR